MTCHNTRMLFYSVFIGAILLLPSCKKDRDGDGIPNCMERKMKNSKAHEFRNIEKIYRIKHDGEYYYYTFSGCCDGYNYFFDSGCTVICAPSGGFTGSGTGDCPDWRPEDLSEYELIWEAGD